MAAAIFAHQTLFQAGETAKPTLNPLLEYDPVRSETSHNRYAILWKVAAVVSAVAFIALATGVTILAALYAEAYLPIVTLLAFYPGMPLSLVPIRHCWLKAQANQEEAKIAHAVNEKMKGLKDSEMAGKVSALVNPGIEATKLKSIFAQYLVLQDRINELEKSINSRSKIEDGKIEVDGEKLPIQNYRLANVNFSDAKECQRFRKYITHKQHIEEDRIKLALETLDAANCLRLMERPYEKKEMTEFISIIDIPLDIRNQLFFNGDLSAYIIAKTPTKDYTSVSINRETDLQLAQEIFNVGAKA